MISLDLSYLAYVLDEAYERLKDVYLNSSVLGAVRLYLTFDDVDREFWTLFCALIDFQIPVARVLNPMLWGLASWIEEKGFKFIHLIEDENIAKEVLKSFRWGEGRIGFVHRFVKMSDLMLLFKIFDRMIKEYGSLRSIVEEAYERARYEDEPMEQVLSSLVNVFKRCGGRPPLVPVKFSSTLKRLNLFFRWMVRPYPDLGLWSFMDKRHLLASLDEGLKRVLSRAFLLRVNLNWSGVLRTTKFLRTINPDDPVKYDYVLSRISIMGYCAKDISKSKCYLCPLMNTCKATELRPEPRSKALKGREGEILERFLKTYRGEFDRVITEYPLGNYSADVLLHKPSCETYVVEVEEELNYNAIGQALVYRYLYFKLHQKLAKPVIICSKSRKELEEV